MPSCPVNGWTLFSLEGTESQLLSYLDDIAPEWLDQAIHGLKTLQPFCVKGFLEPMRMILCGQLLELPYPCGGR